MKHLKPILLIACLFLFGAIHAQDEEFSRQPTLTFFMGRMSYQGDLNPNSFTLDHSHNIFGLSIRKPLGRWFSARFGINSGKLEAADRYNRDYLQPRNLSFTTRITEATASLELTLLNSAKSRIVPYLYGGITAFHFNPWTRDANGVKTFLHPLNTEGQGIEPGQKEYKLTQLALPFGMGIRVAVSDNVNIGIELSQRKTFTDYLDDVSTHFIDHDQLLAARGPKAVELAYRGDEVPGGSPAYPVHGEQRGTPGEMDWYYFVGMTIEVKMSALGSLFSKLNGMHGNYGQRCPRNVNY
jgi:hypothetical protein